MTNFIHKRIASNAYSNKTVGYSLLLLFNLVFICLLLSINASYSILLYCAEQYLFNSSDSVSHLGEHHRVEYVRVDCRRIFALRTFISNNRYYTIRRYCDLSIHCFLQVMSHTTHYFKLFPNVLPCNGAPYISAAGMFLWIK